MRRTRRFLAIGLILLIGGAALWAQSEEKVSVYGSLCYDESSYYLETEDGRVDVCFGSRPFLESCGFLTEPASAEMPEVFLYGYMTDSVLTPMLAVRDGESWFFRDLEGMPLWGGPGSRAEPPAAASTT